MAGRPLKSGVARGSSGKIKRSEQREKVADVRATALAQPHRMGEVSQLAGTPHGRARLRYRQGDRATGITPTQYEAADEMARRVRAYTSAIISRTPCFGSFFDGMVAMGGYGSAPLDDPKIAAIKSNMREIKDALADASLDSTIGRMASVFAYDSPDSDPPNDFWPFARPALNAIANRLKINMPDDPMKKGLDSRPRPRETGA